MCHVGAVLIHHRPNRRGVMTVLGILGGSGVYDIAGLEKAEWRRVASPFGETSDEFLFGVLDGLDVVFVPRHGRGHRHSPTSINYRANIDALKRAGVTDILSLSACGSLREDLPPGHFVVVDQFIDRTFAREKSFFGDGFVAHVGWAIETWATKPSPKKLFSRAKVRSMNWSTTTKWPGGRSSRSEPQADNDRISVTPARFRASMLAR